MGQGPLNAYGAVKKGAAGNFFAPTLLDAQNAQQVAQQHADYYGAGIAGRIFKGANQAGVTTSVALATTYVGICLSNPAASGKILALQRVGGLLNVAPAALTAIGLIAGFAAGGVTVHTTPLTPVSAQLGSGIAPVAKLDAACTLVGTPAWLDWLTVTPGATSVASFAQDMKGAIIIPPGGYVAIGTLIAGPAAGLLGAFEWEEAPLPL